MALEVARPAPGDSVFILPVSLLATHAALVSEFRTLSKHLGVSLGWHYLLDLAWAADQFQSMDLERARILDAGAGLGLMQWWLASRGAEVLSVDRSPRHVSQRLRKWTTVAGYPDPLRPLRRAAVDRLRNRDGLATRTWISKFPSTVRDLVLGDPIPAPVGRVTFAQADLRELSFIESGSIDSIVSISSLEHNRFEDLPSVIAELLRVLRPGGKLVATVGASRDQDWFHEPSRGWCFSEQTLKKVFELPADCPSNCGEYDRLMIALEACAELRDNLAASYRRSGNNGMPWGRWNPQYQSVGVVKVKRV